MDISSLNSAFDQVIAGGMPPKMSPQASPPKTKDVAPSSPVSGIDAAIELINQARSSGDEAAFLNGVSDQINSVVSELGVSVTYKIKQSDSGSYFVEVRDRFSGHVVKTIPPENLVNLKEKLKEELKGILVDDRN